MQTKRDIFGAARAFRRYRRRRRASVSFRLNVYYHNNVIEVGGVSLLPHSSEKSKPDRAVGNRTAFFRLDIRTY